MRSGNCHGECRRLVRVGPEQRGVHAFFRKPLGDPVTAVAAGDPEERGGRPQRGEAAGGDRRAAADLAAELSGECFLPGLRPEIEPAHDQVRVQFSRHHDLGLHAAASNGHSRVPRARKRYAPIPTASSPIPTAIYCQPLATRMYSQPPKASIAVQG